MANDMMKCLYATNLTKRHHEMPEGVVGEQLVVKSEIVRDCTFFAGHREDLGQSRAKN
jgi:hypothetical protein